MAASLSTLLTGHHNTLSSELLLSEDKASILFVNEWGGEDQEKPRPQNTNNFLLHNSRTKSLPSLDVKCLGISHFKRKRKKEPLERKKS